ncbi:MAG: L-seryl-tRNA(Sec) selenium transferase [Planctomycetota bacterium]
MADDVSISDQLRRLPAVHALLADERIASWSGRAPESTIRDAIRGELDIARVAIRCGTGSAEGLVDRILERLAVADRLPLEPAINATGILLHTGLGRAQVSRACASTMAAVAAGAAPVEINLADASRGRRHALVESLLCTLTGAEAAIVVNNNAAALLLALTALARGREVIVSRGELVEIGGSFRLPDVIESGGARLREVGTTNRTRIKDFADAVGADTGALLMVHTSNYRVEGFTEGVTVRELADVGGSHGLPVIVDTGSGLLVPSKHPALADEPDATTALKDGADLVLFSGDKLLGGPQAGIIVGKRDVIARLARNPFMRAVRMDKVGLAGLAVTLRDHLDHADVESRVPVHEMLAEPVESIRARAEGIVADVATAANGARLTIEEAVAYPGGGSMPGQGVASLALCIGGGAHSAETLAARLRLGRPAVVPTVKQDVVRLDMRSVRPHQDEALLAALRTALEHATPPTHNGG